MIIITSHTNYEATRTYFREKQYFGGISKNFIFYQQAQCPLLDLDGKIIMKKTYELQLKPNSMSGQAAIFEAIANNDTIK